MALRVVLACMAVMAGGMAVAQEVPVETATVDGATVTLHLHPFLTPEELATLRVVMSNKDALALFVPSGKGFAALAVAPREGLMRDGLPAESAQAMGGAETAELASTGARAECDRLKKRKPDCVTVLEVAAP